MAKGDRKYAPLFEVRQIDAAPEGEDGWTWNQSFKLFEFRSSSLDLKRMFLSRLRHYLSKGVKTPSGIVDRHPLGRGWYYCTDDWDIMEVKSKADHRPWFACIRVTPSH